mgnify:CR=1 FL=1
MKKKQKIFLLGMIVCFGFIMGCGAGNKSEEETITSIEKEYEEEIEEIQKEMFETLENAAEEDSKNEEFPHVEFKNILGFDGYYVEERPYPFPYYIKYYGYDGEKYQLIAESFGEERDDYVVDFDGDGINELICNVMYGDGALRTIVYRREENKILSGKVVTMLDEEYEHWNVGSLNCSYLPDENVVEISYWKDDIESYLSKKYAIDLAKISDWEEAYVIE